MLPEELHVWGPAPCSELVLPGSGGEEGVGGERRHRNGGGVYEALGASVLEGQLQGHHHRAGQRPPAQSRARTHESRGRSTEPPARGACACGS
eukprot:3185375-Rhodomonas_salina.2